MSKRPPHLYPPGATTSIGQFKLIIRKAIEADKEIKGWTISVATWPKFKYEIQPATVTPNTTIDGIPRKPWAVNFKEVQMWGPKNRGAFYFPFSVGCGYWFKNYWFAHAYCETTKKKYEKIFR